MTAAPRLATTDDVAELVRLREVMLKAMGAVGTGWQTAAAVRFLEGIASGDVVAVVIDGPNGGLCASAVAVLVSTIPSPMIPRGSLALVGSVCTDEAYRRQGLSRAVIRRLLVELDTRQVDVADLHATPDGEALYRSLGFEPPVWPHLRRHRPGRA